MRVLRGEAGLLRMQSTPESMPGSFTRGGGETRVPCCEGCKDGHGCAGEKDSDAGPLERTGADARPPANSDAAGTLRRTDDTSTMATRSSTSRVAGDRGLLGGNGPRVSVEDPAIALARGEAQTLRSEVPRGVPAPVLAQRMTALGGCGTQEEHGNPRLALDAVRETASRGMVRVNAGGKEVHRRQPTRQAPPMPRAHAMPSHVAQLPAGPAWSPEVRPWQPEPPAIGGVTMWSPPAVPPVPPVVPDTLHTNCGMEQPPPAPGDFPLDIATALQALADQAPFGPNGSAAQLMDATAPPPPPTTPGSLLGPPVPLCPAGWEYDYAWQSCWPAGVPHEAPPPGQGAPHACKCEPGESWLVDPDNPHCWRRGSRPAQVWQIPDQILSNCPIHFPQPGPVTPNPDLPPPSADYTTTDWSWQPLNGSQSLDLATANAGTAAPTTAGGGIGDFVGPTVLCPNGYIFDYQWQSCWPEGHHHLRPEKLWQDACRCKPPATFVRPAEKCWTPGDHWVGIDAAAAVDQLGATPPPPACGDDEVFDISAGHCVPNICPDLSDLAIEWWHLPGDCVGVKDDWADRISEFLKDCRMMLQTAYNMLSVMMADLVGLEQLPGPGDIHYGILQSIVWAPNVGIPVAPTSGTYREYLWNFGYEPDADDNVRVENPSLRTWFGPFTDYSLVVVFRVVQQALARISGGDEYSSGGYFRHVQIRCLENFHPLCWDAGDEKFNAWTSSYLPYVFGGRINLCRRWWDSGGPPGTPPHPGHWLGNRTWTLLHELMHFALPYWIANTPHDVRKCNISEDGVTSGDDKCYGPRAALFLADNHDSIRQWNWDQHWSLWVNSPSALCNNDNYTTWLHNRARPSWDNGWGTCTFPIGAHKP